MSEEKVCDGGIRPHICRCSKCVEDNKKRLKFMLDMKSVREGLSDQDVQILKGIEAVEGKRESILLEADKIVNGSRQADYGTPWVNHNLTAQYWSILLGIPISAEQVCKANILQKLARSHNAYKRDNYTDIAGYAENADQCYIEEERVKSK